MMSTLLQSAPATSQWWLVGWVLSIALLAIGYAITFRYYDGEKSGTTPPDVDESPEQGGAA